MPKRNLRVLILGSSGYIGKNLKEYLEGKYNLFTPTHKELDLLNEESVFEYFSSCKADVVINCVTIGGSRKEEEEESDLNNNLRIFFNIINNKRYFKKLIHLGSGAEYDKIRPLKKVREVDFGKRIPRDNYGLFKYICSKYIEKEVNIVNLRLFGLFGKHEDYRYRFISNAICRNIFGLPITIKQDVYFDYVYIDDFIKIVDYFINNESKNKFYNIGTGRKISILSIAKTINQISDHKSKIIVIKKGLNNDYTCNNLRLMNELGTFQFTKLDIAVKELYNWYLEDKKSINKKLL